MRAVLILLALAAAGIAAFFYLRPGDPPPPPPASTPPPTAQLEAPPTSPFDAPAEPPKHPVEAPATPVQEPLPPLKESDPTLVAAMSKLVGAAALERFFNMDEVARRFVATVDNLPREAYASRLNPLQPVPGLFVTTGRDDTLEMAPANNARYAALVAFVDSVDAKRAVDLYIHFYPLFQQSYVELGYPKRYFNDRLVTVIDHLLEAPEVTGPVKLVQPHVLYEYADPALESRSAGHKAMMRVGPENAKRLKAKLREIRRELVARRAAPAK